MELPRSPMIITGKAKSLDEVTISQEWIAQKKEDGGRAWLVKENGREKLYMSHNNGGNVHKDVIYKYPEIKGTNLPNDTILDVEITVRVNNMSVFEKFLSRKSMENPFEIKRTAKREPVTINLIDTVKLNGQDISKKALKDRIPINEKMIETIGNPNYRLIESTSDIKGLFEETKRNEEEGIVMKDLRTPYIFGNSSESQIKIKHIEELDLAVAGFTSKSREMSSLILCDNNGKYVLKVNIPPTWKQWYYVFTENLSKNSLPDYQKSGDEEVFWIIKDKFTAVILKSIKGNREPRLKEIRGSY
jgi:ATP-dependent DNA ligase